MTLAHNVIDDSMMVMIQKVQARGTRRVVSEENVRASLKRGLPPRCHSDSDAQQPLKKRKRVRIQAEPLQVVEPEPLPVDKCCWYTKEELVRSRKVARKVSLAVNTDPVLMETYDKAFELTVIQLAEVEATARPEPSQSQHKASAVKLLKHSSAFWKQRGLERLSKNHAVSRSIQVCSVKSAVLLEQTSQYLDGVQDPERLAHASRMASRPSQHFAQMLAMADQAMADRIHAEAAKTVLGVLPQPKRAVAPTA